MNIKVVCRKDARNSHREVPLIIRFPHRRQTKTISTGIIVNPSVWDKKSQRLTDLSPQYREMQLRLYKLFRRVRDEHGELQLSKRAAVFHPGRGVYRSSYKNARRLAATETNIAYMTADYERWQQLDFVVGIEIKLSNNHTLNGVPFTDICDDLKGRYPKDFKFTGWHPYAAVMPSQYSKPTKR